MVIQQVYLPPFIPEGGILVASNGKREALCKQFARNLTLSDYLLVPTTPIVPYKIFEVIFEVKKIRNSLNSKPAIVFKNMLFLTRSHISTICPNLLR